MRFHACGSDLHRNMRAVSVDEETGQAIALAEYESIKRSGVNRLTKRQRPVDSISNQFLAERLSGIATHQATADQAVRVCVTGAEYRPMVVGEGDRLARLEFGQGHPIDIDFVAEYPCVPGAKTSILALTKSQYGQ
jgi:hypothetical protein